MKYSGGPPRTPEDSDPEAPLLALRVYPGGNNESDRSLMLRARAGDAHARQQLLAGISEPVYRYTLRMLSNAEDARDASQDTLVKVLRHLDSYDLDRPFLTWVFGIARNTCIDEYRRRKRRAWDEPGDVVDPGPPALHLAMQSEDAERLNRSLAALSPLYREVIVLYHFEHLKYTEIADVLEVPLGTVMNRIFRARQKLKDHYENEGGEP